MNDSYKINIITLLKDPKTLLGLFLSFMAVFWAFEDFDFSKFKLAMKDINIIYLILASILLWICVWFRGLRWSYFFNKNESISVASLYRSQLIGHFGNNVLPLRLGEVLRSHIIGQEYSLSRSYVFGTVILERLVDTLTLAALAFLLLLIYPLDEAIKNYVLWGSIISFIIVIIIITLFNIIPAFKSKENKILDIFFNILAGLRSIRKEMIIPLILLSILIWSIYLFDVYLLQKAFNFELNWPQILTILVISSLVLAIPSAPGMIGTFHAAVKYIMVDMFLFTSDEGSAFAILIHAYGYILLTTLGAYYFIKSQFNINDTTKTLDQNLN